ncbi:LuxR family transcriptional regulator [Nonomuraea sp. NPDC048916]|uniref:LuxR family transcriptional regulator n=1 Tax=Nonomuraea sp. NPDC048916 TaxID=3154232 RepID=UPI00340BBB59
MLYGRKAEQAQIGRLLAEAMSGAGGTLVVKGAMGAGKSALLHDAATEADGMRVLSAAGFESEAGQPYASLGLLLRPVLARVDDLPSADARALRAALSAAYRAEDHAATRVALLSLLSGLAAERPLLCLIDDAQWLDRLSADALMFAARRLGSEPIALVVATRDGGPFAAARLPESRLRPLDRASAAEMLAARPQRLAPQARDRIIGESRGNPLALAELAACLTPEQRSGRLNPYAFHDGTRANPGQVLEDLGRGLQRIPASVKSLLLVVAADDTGDLALVTAAAARLGAGPAELEYTERHGLLEADGLTVRFAHPLTRMAVYHEATTTGRRAAHWALAESADEGQAELRVWHSAAATTGPCPELSAELELIAERAGDAWPACAAYERAAGFAQRRHRGRLLAAAARAAVDAGLLDAAADLARRALRLASDADTRAEVARVDAEVDFERGSPATGAGKLIEGTVLIRERAPAKAMLMLAEAFRYAWAVADAGLLREVEAALRAVPLPADSPLTSLTAQLCAVVRSWDGLGPVEVLAEIARQDLLGDQLVAASLDLRIAVTAECEAAEGYVAECGRNGMAGRLPYALQLLARAQLHRGMHAEARATAAAGLDLAVEFGQPHRASHLSGLLGWLAAVAGDDERCVALVKDALGHAEAQEIAPVRALCAWALALLDLGHGRNVEALTRLEGIPRDGAWIGAARRAPDQVEAAVRSGRPDRAAFPLSVLEAWARAHPTPDAEALVERCRALTATGEQAERHYVNALREHERGDQPYEHARTELAFGEWLRRARRRAESRVHLGACATVFERVGATPWAARARAELEATGRPARNARGALTPQQLQIVQLAATGASNRDIADRLFLSPRTVGNHLYRAFPKLGIRSRAELGDVNLDDLI